MKYDFAAERRSALALLMLGLISLSVPLGAQELILNGGFELGNSAFTSAYVFSPGDISSAKTYDVLADPQAAYGSAYSYGDHTSGHGLMLAVNGALMQNTTVWAQTVPINQNTLYTFGLWISSCTTTQPAVLNIYVNEALYGSVQAPATAGVWQYFMINFNSGSADSAAVKILDSNTANNGNDFALDDISLKCCQNSGGQWVPDGIAVCTASGPQLTPDIAPDGADGAIITWYDNRGGSDYDIYAQRVNESGVVQWPADGVAICTAAGDQQYSEIVSDGAGGAIVAWYDARGGSGNDIYIQRVNASGAVLWTADGVAICAAAGDQNTTQLISDGAGGAIVAWQDYRSGNNYDIYAQRVNSSGTVQWAPDGVALCTAAGNQAASQLISDGAGGAIVAWQDSRAGNDIYAQRVSASGAVQWTGDGTAVSTAAGNQYAPQIVTDGAGGAIVAWQGSHGGNDVYAQRVNASGVVQWATDGLTISTATGNQYSPQLVSDGAGGAIVAWQDSRAGNVDVFAQRVNGAGGVQWTADGVAVCTATGTQIAPQLVSDGAGGAIVAWQDSRGDDTDVYGQRVSASGSVRWPVDGAVICTAAGTQYAPRLIADGAGGITVAWDDSRSGSSNDIFAQKVDGAGHTVCATLLQEYAAAFIGAGLVLNWTLSELDESAEFFVMRAAGAEGAPEAPFVELSSSAIGREGLSFSYVDRDWEPGTSYWYRVEYAAGAVRRILFEAGPVTTPAVPLALYPNHPNPFNPSTTIGYNLPEDAYVHLLIFDVAGRRIASLVNEFQKKGMHAAIWNGKGDDGRAAASGVYFSKLEAGKKSLSRKMILLR